MSSTYIREAIGSCDGVNTVFFVPDPFSPLDPGPYVAGSVRGLLNGLALLDDSTIEIDAATGEFHLDEAPRSGDQLLVIFTAPALDESETVTVEEIFGLIKDSSVLGELSSSALSALVSDGEDLMGEVAVDVVDGLVSDADPIYGQVGCD